MSGVGVAGTAITIWRESVAMGDDADAPHAWVLDIADGATIGAVVAEMLRVSYLASIAGGRATWIVDGVRPLAVVAQQWAEPRWLVAPDLPVAGLCRPAGAPDLEMRYWCQVDPERVFDRLRAGEALPDRYGRDA